VRRKAALIRHTTGGAFRSVTVKRELLKMTYTRAAAARYAAAAAASTAHDGAGFGYSLRTKLVRSE
jgi:hypothetical protein